MNKRLTQAAYVTLASIAFVAAATSTAQRTEIRPAPTETASQAFIPTCVQTETGFVCRNGL